MFRQSFTQTLAKMLNKPFFFPNMPAFMLKIIIGEMSNLVLKGSRVSSEKLASNYYKFKYTNLEEALKGLLRSKKANS